MEHEHRVASLEKFVVDRHDFAFDLFGFKGPSQAVEFGVGLSTEPHRRMNAHFVATHTNKFATGVEVECEVEPLRIDKEQVRAQHEIECTVEKRQQGQRRRKITAVHKMLFIVREETLRRRQAR